jgi:hypothetical protein
METLADADWSGLAWSVGGWIAVAAAATGFRRAAGRRTSTRLAGTGPSAAALGLLGVAAAALTAVAALELAYPGNGLAAVRPLALGIGGVGLTLLVASPTAAAFRCPPAI